MSQQDVSNLGFTKILDTVYDSKLFEGLVNAGILPQGFQVIVGTATLTGVIVGDEVAVLGSNGNQIFLSNGKMIVGAFTAETTAITGGATVALGLAAASGDDQNIATSVISVGAANDGFLQTAVPVLVGANGWLTVAVTTATATAGALKVVLVLV